MKTTCLTYNGVTLFGCTTREFSQTPEFDPSGTDYLYTRFKVSVQGYVHAQTLLTIQPPGGGPAVEHPFFGPRVTPVAPVDPQTMPAVNPFGGGTVQSSGMLSRGAAETEALIRHRLMEPRKTLSLFVNVDELDASGNLVLPDAHGRFPTNTALLPGAAQLLWCTGYTTGDGAGLEVSTAGKDLNNGPRPTRWAITRITPAVFRVEFDIEVCMLECGSGVVRSAILSNRWRCSDEIDADLYTTRTIEGLAVLASGQANPHDFRTLVVPRLSGGFRRERMSFTASEDNLNLRYLIVDREVPVACPSLEGTSWRMMHAEHAAPGTLQHGECSLWMKGPRNANKSKMIQVAAAIVSAKLAATSGIVKSMSIIDHLGDSDNAIEVRATVQHLPDLPELDDGQVDVAKAQRLLNDVTRQVAFRIGAPVTAQLDPVALQGFDPSVSRNPGVAGILSYTQAFATAISTGCDVDHSFGTLADASAGSNNSPPPVESLGELYITSGPGYPATSLSDAHKTYPYLEFSAVSKYRFDGRKSVMPVKILQSGTIPTNKTSVVVALSDRQAYRIVRLRASRLNKPPDLPSPEDFTEPYSDIRHSLVNHDIHAHAIQPTPDGHLIYTVEAEYEFSLSRAPTSSEQLRLPQVPWLRNPPREMGSNQTETEP